MLLHLVAKFMNHTRRDHCERYTFEWLGCCGGAKNPRKRQPNLHAAAPTAHCFLNGWPKCAPKAGGCNAIIAIQYYDIRLLQFVKF